MMFVDIVSSECDVESLENFREIVGKWNHHDVKQLTENLICRKTLAIVEEKKAQLIRTHGIKPMMSSCSGSYKQNPDGSWEITGEIKFTNGEEKEVSNNSEKSNESSSGQETTSKDYDPPDSRDRDQDRN